MKARKEAQEADLVVVNHHLFFADAALRGNGSASELLPSANTVIFDEAHQLPEIAAAFFARGLRPPAFETVQTWLPPLLQGKPQSISAGLDSSQ